MSLPLVSSWPTLTLDLTPEINTRTARSSSQRLRRVSDLLTDEDFRADLVGLREWSSHPIPMGRPDPVGTESFLRELARRISRRITDTLLEEAERQSLSKALREQGRTRLVIRAAAREGRTGVADAALALPWELLAPGKPEDYPARDGRLSVVREAVAPGAPILDLPTGPLTLAVSIAAPESPEGRTSFSYERESFRLLSALTPLGQRAAFANLGGLDDLVALVAHVDATAIHFRGHGLPGSLLFEDELGFGLEVQVTELKRRLHTILLDHQRSGKFPGLFFLAAPYTARHAEEASTAAALHRGGFAQVVGYFGPIDAEINTLLEERFYGAVAGGASTLTAVEEARKALLQPVSSADERVHYPFGWCQLAVYHRGPDLPLARPGRAGRIPSSQRRTLVISGLPVLEHGFIGRRGELHEIRRKVQREEQRLIVIQGLGGLGKTALASQLLFRAFTSEPADRLILRCEALSETPVEELRSQAEEHGRLHGIPQWEDQVSDLRERITGSAAGLAAVLRRLREERPGLVVYVDNAESFQSGPETDDPGALGAWRPGLEAWWAEMQRLAEEDGCLVLVTTRYNWPELPLRAYVGLPPMTAADSLRLIDSFETLQNLPREVRRRLAERVDGHPRTVELLATLIAQRSPEVADGADVWEELVIPILPIQHEKIRADLLLEELWKRLSQKAHTHAQRLTVLRRPAPYYIIDRMGKARDGLIRSGLLTRYREQILHEKGDGETHWFDLWGLHGSTRDFLRSRLDERLLREGHFLAAEAFRSATRRELLLRSDQAEAIHHSLVIGHADRAWPILRDHVIWLRDRARFGESLRILERCEGSGLTGNQLALALVFQMQARYFLGERGKDLTALLDRAWGFAEDPESRSAILQEEADLLDELGRFREAEGLLRRALEIDRAAFGTGHPNYCATLHSLASILDSQHRHGEAEELFREEIEHLTREYGSTHTHTCTAYHALAGNLFLQGRYRESEEAIRRSLADPSQGPEHPGFAASLHSLAQALERQGKHSEAEDVVRRGLAVLEDALGEDHPSCAVALESLAEIVMQRGRPEEAERLVRRSLGIWSRVFGEDHFEYGTSLQILGATLAGQGSYRDAEEAHRRAISIQEAALGKEDAVLLPSLHGLAMVLMDQLQLEEAGTVLRRALALSERQLGSDHPKHASTLRAFGNFLRQSEQLEEAEKVLRRALCIEKETFGDQHPAISSILHDLALVLDDLERYDEAEAAIRRALSIDEQRLGSDHPTHASSLHELALILNSQENLEEAVEVMRRALKIKEKELGRDRPELAIALTNLARLLMDAADSKDFESEVEAVTALLEEAEALLERALPLAAQSEDPQDLPQAMTARAELRFTLGYEDAEPAVREALETLERNLPPDHPAARFMSSSLKEMLETLEAEV